MVRVKRQYEKGDCRERNVLLGQMLEVCFAHFSPGPGGEVDIVYGFGNPKTRELVWLPYNSQVLIEDQRYSVVEGKRVVDPTWDDVYYDKSIRCLVDKEKQPHSLEDFLGKEAEILSLGRETLTLKGILTRLFFPRRRYA